MSFLNVTVIGPPPQILFILNLTENCFQKNSRNTVKFSVILLMFPTEDP